MLMLPTNSIKGLSHAPEPVVGPLQVSRTPWYYTGPESNQAQMLQVVGATSQMTGTGTLAEVCYKVS